jgi:von Willebrand factor type A domain-containing protein
MLTGIDYDSLSFGEPTFLWLLLAPAVLMVLWGWQVLRRRADARRYRQRRLTPVDEHFTMVGDLAFWFCLLLAACSCIVALARPQARTSVVRRASADFVLLQDGSSSMYVTDVKPDRWRRSVQFLRAFAEALSWKGDRVALALFAHLASPQLRLTKDPNSFFFFLDHLSDRSPFRLEDLTTWDTNIEEGVYWGVKLVEKDEELFGKTRNPKAFVVVSDGQSWSGNVASALAEARARDIVVHVVGVGTTQGGLIPEGAGPDGIVTPNGFFPVAQPQRPRMSNIRGVLDRNSLRTIAHAGGGEYFELGREPDRDVAFRIISSVRRRAQMGREETSQEELYWRFLFAAAVILCLGTFVLKEGAELWGQVGGATVAILLLAGALS